MTKERGKGEGKIWAGLARAEHVLLRMVVLGFVLMILAQTLLSADPFRFYLSFAERLEGEPIAEWQNPEALVLDTENAPFAHLTIELADFSSLAKADLLINGQQVANFREKRITVKVRAGDVIAVDGSFYHQPLDFFVADTSSHIAQPAILERRTTESSQVSFTQVQLK